MDQMIPKSSMDSLTECPSCGGSNVSSTKEVEQFRYGDKENAPTLTALVSVYHCPSCDFSFTTEEASELRQEAVCRYLGVFTPHEVRKVRERYGLTQSDFADLSRIGKASLARWESGVLVQNQANDNYLYLLSFLDNVERLKDRVRSCNKASDNLVTNVVLFRPKFRSFSEADVEQLQPVAKRFQLFLSVAGA